VAERQEGGWSSGDKKNREMRVFKSYYFFTCRIGVTSDLVSGERDRQG